MDFGLFGVGELVIVVALVFCGWAESVTRLDSIAFESELVALELTRTFENSSAHGGETEERGSGPENSEGYVGADEGGV